MNCQLCGAGYRKGKVVHVVRSGKLVRKRVCLACEQKCIVVHVPDVGETLCVLCAKERATCCEACKQKQARTQQRREGAITRAGAAKLRAMAKAYQRMLSEPGDGLRAEVLEQAADIIEAGRF